MTTCTAPSFASNKSHDASTGSVPRSSAICHTVLPCNARSLLQPTTKMLCQPESTAGFSQPGRAARISSVMR